MSQITSYKGIKKIYFNKILSEIIKIGNLKNNNKIILDYGCGEKHLSKLLNKQILNYDIKPELTEIKNIDSNKFDIIVINHVLMYLTKNEIQELFNKIHNLNSSCIFIFGIGKQNIISKIAKTITFNFYAHSGTITSYSDQLELVKKNFKIIKKKNIFFMTDIFLSEYLKK